MGLAYRAWTNAGSIDNWERGEATTGSPLQHLGSGGAAVTVNHSETGDISASYRFRTGLDLNYVKPTLY